MKKIEELTIVQESLLLKEASMTSTSIGNGLTLLRKADISNKGNYYQSFFQLTIGLERLMKIIIISKYRGENERFPNNRILKEYGHKISNLFDVVSEYYNGNYENPKQNNICCEMLTFLTEYAMNTRYYNLDVLTNREVNTLDPLIHWSNIQNLIRDKHKKHVAKEKQKFMNLLNTIMNENSAVYIFNEQNKLITNYNELATHSDDLDFIQGYATFYMLKILDYLIDNLINIEEQYKLYPFLREFFYYYHGDHLKPYEKRRKKNWIYP